jgi:hypothetical protein
MDTNNMVYYHEPLWMKTTDNGIGNESNIVIIGEYWDNHVIANILNLLREYANLFPHNFMEMKDVIGELSEMKIELDPRTWLIKKGSIE